MSKATDISASYVRNFIFGVEDSLVSTVGLLSGVAIADVGRSTIVLTGIVLIFVEAISMGAGSFLSESSAREFTAHAARPLRPSIAGGAIMFFSYFLAGFIPLFPYLLIDTARAVFLSIGSSLASLCILGVVSARLSHTSALQSSLRMLVVGGLAIAVGAVVGGLLTAG